MKNVVKLLKWNSAAKEPSGRPAPAVSGHQGSVCRCTSAAGETKACPLGEELMAAVRQSSDGGGSAHERPGVPELQVVAYRALRNTHRAQAPALCFGGYYIIRESPLSRNLQASSRNSSVLLSSFSCLLHKWRRSEALQRPRSVRGHLEAN